MKCQKCNKQATFHITEMIDANPVEYHFCEEHAREYLHQNGMAPMGDEEASLDGLREATDELTTDDFQTCPCCSLGFQDFRKTGILGCANDYREFSDALEPFLKAVHGSTKHFGKRPNRKDNRLEEGVRLVRLRAALADAVSVEDYENAAKFRDQIAALEKEVCSTSEN